MKGSLRCQYPMDRAPHYTEPCDKPAVWETDGLQAVHHLCDEHCKDALMWNDFQADPVNA